METHRVKRQNRFARFVHRLNLLLEPLRGTHCAKLADCIYYHWYSRICCCNPTNVANKAAAADVRTVGADADNVIRRSDIGASAGAQGSVVAAGTVRERVISVRRVAGAGGVAKERLKTGGRVGGTGRVLIERAKPVGGIAAASGVLAERSNTDGRVGVADGVQGERAITDGCVEAACDPGDIALESRITDGGVAVAGCIETEGEITNGSV